MLTLLSGLAGLSQCLARSVVPASSSKTMLDPRGTSAILERRLTITRRDHGTAGNREEPGAPTALVGPVVVRPPSGRQ